MQRAYATRLEACVLPMDVLVCALVFVEMLALQTPHISVPAAEVALPALLAPGLVACLAWPLTLDRLASRAIPGRQGVAGRLLLAGVVSTALLAAVLVVTGSPVGAGFSLSVAAGQLAALGSLRLAALGASRLLQRDGRNFRNVLIVGSGARARQALHVVQRHRAGGLRVVGFLDEGAAPHDARIPADRVFELRELPEIIRKHVIDEVIVACPRSMLGAIGPVLATCAGAGVPLTLLSDLFGDYLPPPKVTRLGNLAALSFAPEHPSALRLAADRAIAALLGSAALLRTATATLRGPKD